MVTVSGAGAGGCITGGVSWRRRQPLPYPLRSSWRNGDSGSGCNVKGALAVRFFQRTAFTPRPHICTLLRCSWYHRSPTLAATSVSKSMIRVWAASSWRWPALRPSRGRCRSSAGSNLAELDRFSGRDAALDALQEGLGPAAVGVQGRNQEPASSGQEDGRYQSDSTIRVRDILIPAIGLWARLNGGRPSARLPTRSGHSCAITSLGKRLGFIGCYPSNLTIGFGGRRWSAA